MLNFDTELDRAGTRRIVKAVTAVPTIKETVSVRPIEHAPEPSVQPPAQPNYYQESAAAAPASTQTSYVARDTDQWTWQDVRDYVVREIEQRFGTFPRDLVKESGIFKSFASRWGSKAGLIAKCAFEVHDGMWRGAPISVTRFTKGSDPYFSEKLAERL